ncbi:hypothetical protein JOC86_000592 [Bacillus pakistanensis]|uniref:Polyketide cyclase / dehydrase and lipid transport n=1 Tax=Rossellomorea pakistanensis TaxID=992288 RepID=A0ABS2N8F0_9BACI|nr:SRPBCC family protein [Bacillus pakistanensis]MBM7584055.1 hypothetical protein [Bacillus pakistanensis]
MIKVESKIFINREYQEVFRFISNFENNTLWQKGMKKAQFTTSAPIGIGSTYEQEASFLGKKIVSSFIVTDFKEDHLIKIKSTASSFPIQVTRSVEPVGTGTKVYAIVEGDAMHFFKLAQPILKKFVGNSINADYKRLKETLEK